jgi:protein SCO1
VDSQTDTPARLDKWAGQFHANSRWTLLTGATSEVNKVLKAFGVYTPDKFTHSSVVVIMNAKGEFTRSDGLGPPEELMKLAYGLLPAADAKPLAEAEPSPAQRYFTDMPLVDQNGAEHRFYTDLIKGKVIIINTIFTSCKDSCPMLTANFARMQEWLGARLNTDVRMLSISVDPETDTPQRLKAYADTFKARPGWYFLTGRKENISLILQKLGQYAGVREDHSNIFLIGNDRTGLWKKAFGMAAPEKLIETLDSVLRDRG